MEQVQEAPLKLYDMSFDLSEYPHIDPKAIESYDKSARADVNWQEKTDTLPLSNWTKGAGFHKYPLKAQDSSMIRSIYMTPQCRSITVEFYAAGSKVSTDIKKKMPALGFYFIEQADPRHVCTHHGGDMGIVHDHWFKRSGYINVFNISEIMDYLKLKKCFGTPDKNAMRRYGRDKVFFEDHTQHPKDTDFRKSKSVHKDIQDWLMSRVD
jgi:hypothetical protein